MNTDDQIDKLCRHLPDEWEVRIDIERGAATVYAIRPDGSEVMMGSDGESGIPEQLREAGILAHNETESARLLANVMMSHAASDSKKP